MSFSFSLFLSFVGKKTCSLVFHFSLFFTPSPLPRNQRFRVISFV